MITAQPAGTPLQIKMVSILVGYSLETTKMICKWTSASGILAHSVAIARSIPKQYRDSGRKIFTTPCLFFLYFCYHRRDSSN